jgi:hypothetical protein
VEGHGLVPHRGDAGVGPGILAVARAQLAEGVLGGEQARGQGRRRPRDYNEEQRRGPGVAEERWHGPSVAEERRRYAPPHPSPPRKCAVLGDLTHRALCRLRRRTTTPATSPMELHTGRGLPHSAMTVTSWIWSEVDVIIAEAELFPDLAATVVLSDDGGLGLDLGLAGLDLGSGVF